MKLFPDDSVFDRAEAQLSRIDKVIPKATGQLNDYQKYQLYMRNPLAAEKAVPEELRPAFLQDMNRLITRFGVPKP